MIKNISFYDFDGTLFNTPLPDSGKKYSDTYQINLYDGA